MKTFILVLYLFSLILNSQCAYQLVWSDEFNGNSLNLVDWNIEDTNEVYNNELEAYKKSNVALVDGNLVLTAKKESYLGKSYTSGRINTDGKKLYTFGRFEARIKMPLGKGLWPAFWLFPTNYNANSYGEIDIMEALGDEPTTIYGTCYVGGNENTPWHYSSETKLSETYDLNYHIYSAEWTPGLINYYVDGVKYYTCEKSKTKGWEIDNVKFYVLFNLAVGGDWPGSPNSATPFPSSMYVDWVRVYQDDGLSPTPTPTPTPTPNPTGQTSCSSYTTSSLKNGINYLKTVGKVNTSIISSKKVSTKNACCALCGQTVDCIAYKTVSATGGFTCSIYKKI